MTDRPDEPRVAPIDELDDELAEILSTALTHEGRPLNIFGVTSPGWFMKTEYRSAFYNAKTQTEVLDAGNVPLVNSVRANSWNQTISTSLVYRFNWTGPVVAKY